MKKLRPAISLALFLIVSSITGGLLGPRMQAIQQGGDREIQHDLKKFARVYQIVAQNYAEPVKANDAIYHGAIPGMLRVLDPHSFFLDPAAFARMEEQQSSHYYGVGMEIRGQGDHTVIWMPFIGAPAFKAGLRPGDVIVGVDGISTTGFSTDKVAKLLKGPKGTTVHIAVMREGHAKPLNFTVVRAAVHDSTVTCAFLLRPGIGFIHLGNSTTGFAESTYHDLRAAIASLGGPAHLQGLILDLRDNPGGLLTQAVDVAGMFLAKGQVVVSHHGRSSPQEVLTATHGNHGHDYALVVLVNNDTASAAEIVSGAIQDHDRGLIAGQTTFGKGLVQTVIPLPDNTALGLTTAHYYTPSGRLIQRDYDGMPLYDYFWAHDNRTAPSHRQVKMTDSGRIVYGGGGITPDVVLSVPKLDDFQKSLYPNLLTDRFLQFADFYLSRHNGVPADWKPGAHTLSAFQAFLKRKRIPFTAQEIAANADWIKLQIREHVITNLYGQDRGLEIDYRHDPEVASAIKLLPQAQALEQHAMKLLAQRERAGLHQQ